MKFSRSTLLLFLSLETLATIIRTRLPILVELINMVNSVIVFLSQTTLLSQLTFLLQSQTVIFIVLLFWISFFLLTLVFVLQWLSLHWEILIILLPQFPSNSQQDFPFHRIAYDYCCADWDGLHGHLRAVLWEDIFKLSASAVNVYNPDRKYQVKPHWSPWFSAACAGFIVHTNHFFRLY